MYDISRRSLNFRAFIHGFTRDYARFADLVAADDNARSIATSYFHGLHKGLVRALDLDDDATPDHVITAVYAFYRAHGADATERMICAQPHPALDFFSHDFAR